MRAGPRRGAAAAARTVFVALLVAATVAGAGYGIQRVGLRAPSRGERLTAQAIGIVLRYRYVKSDVRIAGRPALKAECMQGWTLPIGGRPGGRGARVVLSDGARLLAGDREIARLQPGSSGPQLRPVLAVLLAGCPRPLTDYLAKRMVGGTRPRAVPATFDGHAAYRMHVRTVFARFDVFVDRKTMILLGVRLEAPHLIGWSDVHTVLVTPTVQRAFMRRFHG